MDETVDLDALALASAGLVGSDLANIINEAAIIAVKHDRKFVNQSDLFEAFELVAVGGKEKKDRVMSDKERKIVSYHEVGHALVSRFAEEHRAGTKDHDCTAYHGCFGLYLTDSGGGEVLRDQG